MLITDETGREVAGPQAQEFLKDYRRCLAQHGDYRVALEFALMRAGIAGNHPTISFV